MGLDGDLGADESRLEAGVGGFQQFKRAHVGSKGRARCMQHGEIIFVCLAHDCLEIDSVRHGIDQFAVWDHGCRLRQPRRVPEGSDLPARLITRARAAIESLIGRRLQE